MDRDEYSSSDNSSVWDDSEEDDYSSDSGDEALRSVRTWCKHNTDIPLQAPPAFPFTGNPGLHISSQNLLQPVDYFNLFF